MTVKLGFNVDHIATIREARKICEPDPIAAAVLAEIAGAAGITMHLREDKQHIQDRDVQLLRRTVTTKMNLEISPTQEMLQVAIRHTGLAVACRVHRAGPSRCHPGTGRRCGRCSGGGRALGSAWHRHRQATWLQLPQSPCSSLRQSR